MDRALAFAAECGYTGIEIAPFTLGRTPTEVSAPQRGEIRRQAAQAGMDVVGLHWLLARTEGLHVTSPDKQIRNNTADYLAELARLCADLGGRIMVFGSPKQRNLLPGVTRRDATRYAAEVLGSVLPVLEGTNVVLALEPLTTDETDFLTTAAETVALIEQIGSPHVRLHLDCKAMAGESEPIPELVRRHRGHLAHFHANDPNRQGPGFGPLDFVPILRSLIDADYREWVSVEVFDLTPGVERLARESIRYLWHCLASLGS